MRIVLAILLCLPLGIRAQQLSGSLDPALGLAGHWIVLLRNSGMVHHAIDSVQVNKRGEFRFRNKNLLTGYYRIGFEDDQVDIILNPIETEVNVHFDGRPLRDHLQVKASMENERLWEYKYASRDAQAQSKRITGQRSISDPRNADALIRLAAEEDAVNVRLQAILDRLVAQDSASYFSKVIITDRKLMAALPEGPLAVRNAMDWIDPSLTRSAIYARAIMAILQSATPALPDVLNTTADSVLHWASPDTTCWSFARAQLIGVFTTYGPEEVVQHLVDQYVSGPRSLTVPDAHLITLVAEQLKASIGSIAPDAELPSPLTGRTDRLSELLAAQPLTLLFFYSSTCDHCHEQMGPLNALHRRYLSKGLQILGVALDDDEAEFKANVAERQLAFPCYSELMAWGSPTAKTFAVRATPWLVLLNREGRILAKPHDAAELGEMLQTLLP